MLDKIGLTEDLIKAQGLNIVKVSTQVVGDFFTLLPVYRVKINTGFLSIECSTENIEEAAFSKKNLEVTDLQEFITELQENDLNNLAQLINDYALSSLFPEDHVASPQIQIQG